MTFYSYIHPFAKTKITHSTALTALSGRDPSFRCSYHGLVALVHGLEHGHDIHLPFSSSMRTSFKHFRDGTGVNYIHRLC
jgi:hypothetical protein